MTAYDDDELINVIADSMEFVESALDIDNAALCAWGIAVD